MKKIIIVIAIYCTSYSAMAQKKSVVKQAPAANNLEKIKNLDMGSDFGNSGFKSTSSMKSGSSQTLTITMSKLSSFKIPEEDGCVFGNCENGEGIYIYTSGDRYGGFFAESYAQGKGIFIGADGTVYDGDFSEDSFIKGKITYKNGDVYNGACKGGLKDGMGKMTYSADKSTLEGYWAEDQYVGKTKPKE